MVLSCSVSSLSLKTITCKYSDYEKLTKNITISVHWLALCTLLCPLFSPVYAFTSVHYLKHKGIPLYPLSSLLPLYFFLCSTSLSSALLISSLDFPPAFISPHFSPLLVSYSFFCVPLFGPPASPSSVYLGSPLLAWLPFSPFFSSPVSSLPSVSYISVRPPLPSFLLLSVSPPLTTTVHPLMIAQCISFDMKTKG